MQFTLPESIVLYIFYILGFISFIIMIALIRVVKHKDDEIYEIRVKNHELESRVTKQESLWRSSPNEKDKKIVELQDKIKELTAENQSLKIALVQQDNLNYQRLANAVRDGITKYAVETGHYDGVYGTASNSFNSKR